jgi:Na+-translocating ferredoxin:NAD+ oxidoreductase RnfG subunit
MFMQNEFEKQVQQKMEELRLVPSEPVWQKVEMQIQKKKDRRRMILWIPLFLLIGAGLWIGVNEFTNTATVHHSDNKPHKQSSEIQPQSNNHTTEQNNQTSIGANKSENAIVYHHDVTKNKQHILTSAVIDKKSFYKKHGKQISIAVASKIDSKPYVVIQNKITSEEQSQTKANIPLDTAFKAGQSLDTAGTTTKNLEQKNISEPAKQDSTLIKKNQKKHVSSWKYNVIAVAGTSGLGRINFYNGQKFLNYSPNYSSSGSTSGNNPPGYGPSEVEKAFYFAAGVVAKKTLGKRIFLSTGLQYNYYSNMIEVGSMINQNTVIMDYAVSQFYSSRATAMEPYKNQYHFICVPAVFDWQLLKKFPLNFNAGFSLQYLAGGNALRFDYTTQSYFHSIDAFNRTQVFTELGLTYSVPLKQKALTFGPQLQYGLTQLEKDNPEHHLFSLGLKAQWQLSRN